MPAWDLLIVVLLVATGLVPVDVSQVMQNHVVVQMILPIHLLVGVITAVAQGAVLNVFVIGGIVGWTPPPHQRQRQRVRIASVV